MLADSPTMRIVTKDHVVTAYVYESKILKAYDAVENGMPISNPSLSSDVRLLQML
jgi:hypothetical protein